MIMNNEVTPIIIEKETSTDSIKIPRNVLKEGMMLNIKIQHSFQINILEL